MIETLVIGAGPSGITAATYLKNFNHDVLVVAKDLGELTKHDVVTNLYGQAPIAGPVLFKKAVDEARALGITVLFESVISIEKKDNSFLVITTKNTYETKTVVLATGRSSIPLEVLGFDKLRGRGIHFCVTCDGFFYKKKAVGIIGAGPFMESELKVLENFTDNITIFTEGTDYTHPTYKVVKSKIVEFSGDRRLNLVKTENESYELNGVFVALGFPRASVLALKLGVITEDSNILVDEHYKTNIEGVFSGGDAIGGKYQITKAISDGMNMAYSIHEYLKNKK